MKLNSFGIKAVLFDYDGTLTKPGAIDFTKIREMLGCPIGTPILEYIDTIVSPGEKRRMTAILKDMEMEAASVSEPNTDAEQIVAYLKDQGLAVGIISRNSLASIERSLRNFEKIGPADFDLIVSRDLPLKPKPHPDGIVYAAEKLCIPVERILVVGDFIFDIHAGNAAGAKTVFISNGVETQISGIDPNAIITRLRDLKAFL